MKEPFQALIVGDGDERPVVESLVHKHSLTNISVVGPRCGTDLVETYRWADVLVLPSDREGMPLVVLEAMASGVPVVATNVMGNRELVAGVGLLVEPEPTSIALALDRLAQDAGLRVQLTDLGLAAVRNWTWDRLARRIEQVYAKAGSA